MSVAVKDHLNSLSHEIFHYILYEPIIFQLFLDQAWVSGIGQADSGNGFPRLKNLASFLL